MKRLGLTFLIALVISCCGQKSEIKNIVASNPFLIGKWTGEGGFLDVNLDKEVGKVMFEIEINNDNTVSGKIGDARLTKTSIIKANYGFEIKGVLDSRIKKNKNVKKNHLIILLVTPLKNSNDVMESDANFHLKNNYIFDFNMRVGGVQLTKVP
jgi:hypothetical protein